MIPKVNDDLVNDFTYTESPSYTYKMEIDRNRVLNHCDDLEAVKQAIYKIINTERYQYPIYSWNYGIELKDLFGEPTTYCIPEIERRITEALLQDERITDVFDFEFTEPKKGQIYTTFKVQTTKGTIDLEKVVNV